MTELQFRMIEDYMLRCMEDSAHDSAHIYRVLYTALDIAQREKNVDYPVLIAACLLHDVGRQEQFCDPSLCHAAVGAEKAEAFLLKNGFSPEFCAKTASCIRTHRFRSSSPPECLEGKILFDADKADVTGAVGIARTLLYDGETGTPLYTLDGNGHVSDGSRDTAPSFFQEYKYKLERLYSGFYTERGREIAAERQNAAASFYQSILDEVSSSYDGGIRCLSNLLE